MTHPIPISEADFLKTTGQSVGQPMNYADLYLEAVQRFPTGSVFVEVGVYKGRSADFLIREMQKAGKKFEIHLVDIMSVPLLRKHNDLLRKNCFLHAADSVSAAGGFEDGTVDFVWIDANHEYEAVKADIEVWLPKVRAGGVIAGHDYFRSKKKSYQVIEAVDELFPNARISHKSWWQEVDLIAPTPALQFASST